MHSSPLEHPQNLPYVENYKECAICAILREKTTFSLAATKAKTCCAMLHRGPKIMQIPRGYQKKKCLWRRKSAILSVRLKFHCMETIRLALFIQYLATLFVGKNWAQNVTSHSQLHAQRSKMHSNPLGPSEINSFG